MSATPLEKPLPPRSGGRTYAAIGYALRAIKALPAPLRERVLDGAKGGVSSKLPPFPDVLRLVEAAGGLPDGRRWQERLLAERPHLRGVRIHDVASKGPAPLRARLYRPPAGAPPATSAFVWVHGGAFVIGSLDQKEAHWPAIELAAAGIPVLSVDYRMCINGVHYPEPQDDVLTAWRWANENVDQLGVEASQLHLGGASAGGCLVAGAVMRLRDAGEPLPASIFLGYPVLQASLPPATQEAAEALATLTTLVSDDWVRDMFRNWTGDRAMDVTYATPGLASPVGLPPTYVLTCGRDSLRRASEPFVDRLRAADVAVWHDVLDGSEHAPLDRPGTADGEVALERVRTWLTTGVPGMNP